MAWTVPQTWSSQLVTVDEFNEQIRDNMLALKDPPSGHWDIDDTDYTTTSDSFVDVSAVAGELEQTINTNGGDVMVWFFGIIRNTSASGGVAINVSVDGTDHAAGNGLLNDGGSTITVGVPVCFWLLVSGLSSGSHTFRLRYMRTGGNGTAELLAASTHGQFGAREIS